MSQGASWCSERRYVPWTPPGGGLSGISNQEMTTRQTQDILERLCLPAGPGTPVGVLGEELEEMAAETEVWASAQAAALSTQN